MLQKPYKFLDAFEKEDFKIFFGREKEVEEVHSRLFYGNLLVLYGASGTGKTSILNCGLYNKIPESDWKPIYVRRKLNIIDSIGKELEKLARTPLKENHDVNRKLRSIYLDYLTPVFLIFDQLEELFIFGGKKEKEDFVEIITRIKEDPEKHIKVIFIIREEFLANLSILESSIPNILDNRYRIERMDHSHLLEVIERPAEVCEVQLDEGLADEVIEKITDDKGNTELTYIQVLMDYLYKIAESRDPDKPHIKAEDMHKLGHLGNLMSKFLDDQLARMEHSKTGEDVLKTMVSPDGTKKPMQLISIRENLTQMGKKIGETELLKIVQYFVRVRIFREKDENGFYELRHDSLAKRIFERMTLVEKELIEVKHFIDQAYEQYRRRRLLLRREDLHYIAPYQSLMHLSDDLTDFIYRSKRHLRKSKRRRLWVAFSSMFVLLIILSGLTLWALNEKEKSYQSYLQAKASNFTYLSQSFIDSDPTLAIRLAEHAVNLDPESQGIYRNLNRIYYDHSFYKIDARMDEDIWSVCYATDGSMLLTGSRDKAHLRDEQGRIINELGGHDGWVTAVAIAPDQQHLITGAEDGIIRVWATDGRLLHQLHGHTDNIYTLAFDSSGKQFLSGSEDGSVRLWDVQGTNNQLITEHGVAVFSVAFTSDNQKVIVASECGKVRVKGLDGTLHHMFAAHKGCITAIALSADGQYLLTASEDQTARLWNMEGRLIQIFSGHEDWLTDVGFSPDGAYVVTASADNTARTWHVEGEMLQELKGHSDALIYARFDKNGLFVRTTSLDRTSRSWEMQENELQRFGGFRSPILSATMAPDGRHVLTGSDDKTARLYDVNGKMLLELKGHQAYIRSVAISSDGNHLLTGSGDRTARLWDMAGNTLQVFSGHERHLTSVAFSPDDKYVLTGSDDRTARLWDRKGNELQVFRGHDARVSAVAFAPDGSSIITASWDQTCRKYDLKGNLEQVFRGHESYIYALAFSGDGTKVLTGSWDKTARMWDIYGNVLQVFEGHGANVSSVAFAPDGKRVLTGSYDNTARTWDLKGNMQQIFDGHIDQITTVVFAPDGSSVLTASWDYSARLWHVAPTHDDYFRKGNYENLSIGQKIEFMILSHEEVLRHLNSSDMLKAAMHYKETAERLDTEMSVVYLDRAAAVFNRLLQTDFKHEYAMQLVHVNKKRYHHHYNNKLLLDNKKLIDSFLSINHAYKINALIEFFSKLIDDAVITEKQDYYHRIIVKLHERILQIEPEYEPGDEMMALPGTDLVGE